MESQNTVNIKCKSRILVLIDKGVRIHLCNGFTLYPFHGRYVHSIHFPTRRILRAKVECFSTSEEDGFQIRSSLGNAKRRTTIVHSKICRTQKEAQKSADTCYSSRTLFFCPFFLLCIRYYQQEVATSWYKIMSFFHFRIGQFIWPLNLNTEYPHDPSDLLTKLNRLFPHTRVYFLQKLYFQFRK